MRLFGQLGTRFVRVLEVGRMLGVVAEELDRYQYQMMENAVGSRRGSRSVVFAFPLILGYRKLPAFLNTSEIFPRSLLVSISLTTSLTTLNAKHKHSEEQVRLTS